MNRLKPKVVVETISPGTVRIWYAFIVYGPPAGKKNSPRLVKKPGDKACPLCGRTRHRVMPSEQYEKWNAAAIPQLRAQWRWPDLNRLVSQYIEVEARCFLAKGQRPDLLSLLEAVADSMEDAGILANDYFIDSWDGSKRDRSDPKNPRVEIVMKVLMARDRSEKWT